MPRPLSPPESDDLRKLVAALSPDVRTTVVPGLVDEIVERIRAAIPAYARPPGSAYNRVLHTAVERNVLGFLDWLADPSRPLDRRDELCRKMGAFEAMEGRPLTVLQSAYRAATQVAWSRIRAMLDDRVASVLAVSALAEAVIDYMDEAAALSREGYEKAKAEECGGRAAARLALLRALVAPAPSVEPDPAADWPLPDEVTLVALPAGTLPVSPLLDADVLLDPEDPAPYLLVPGPLTGERRAMLEAALAGDRAAVGLTVPRARAADSLRWARRLLDLGDVLHDGTLTLCEDHLMSLWLLADGALIDQITRRGLAPLAPLSDRRRQPLVDTLAVWLRTRAPATRISEELGVHVQTVRYRMRVLEHLLGDELADPGTRFAVETALRAHRLRARGAGDRPVPCPPDTGD
ncbi:MULTISPECIES: PucR family transcriptional regulator [unclassified Actinomadura]|uniref:PucR family transcriptional regulator n=1 Tax=unclassified Actinomadura TaxID=2626254 RepID=UPI0011F00F88|nr:PucR family transcriptional regulator [Actinomadura sp. K4S16]